MSVRNVPHEVYTLVFRHLVRKDIYQCMLVCKYWYSPAVETYYYRVILLSKNINYLKSNILYQTCRQLQFGHWVKHLKLNPSQSTFTTKEFKTLISYFPNLTLLDILNCSDQAKYLQVLAKMGETEFRHLQVIKTRTNEFLAFHQFSKRLARLHLDELDKIYTINGISGNAISFLPDFTCLTNLKVRNKASGSDDIVIFQILNACQNLESFGYVSKFAPAEDIEDYRNRAIIASVSSHGNKHLRRIQLHVSTLMKPFIQYFTTCIPFQHLQSFSLNIETDFSHWIYENGSNSIMEFASCLANINNDLYISFGAICERVCDVQTKVLNYWTFLGRIKGKRNTFHRTNYFVSQDEKRRELLVSLNSRDNILTLELGIWIPDYFVTNAASGVSNFSMPLPTTTAVGPWITDELNIHACENLKGVSIYLLKFSLNHCPELKKFWIRSLRRNGIEFFAGGKDMCQVQTKQLTLSYNLLKVICNRLPNATKFVAHHPVLVKEDAFSNNTRINFSGFKQLKELVLDLQHIHIQSFQHVFLQLEYISSGNEYYKIKAFPENQKHSLTATTIDFIQTFDGSSITVIIQLNDTLCKLTLEDNGEHIGNLPFGIIEINKE